MNLFGVGVTANEALTFMTIIVTELTKSTNDDTPQRNAQIVKFILEDQVVIGELIYARRMLRRDRDLDKKLHFDGGITYADISKYIFEIRNLRHRLYSSQMTKLQISKLVEQFAGLISEDMFGLAGSTATEEPLFKFFPSDEAQERAKKIPSAHRPTKSLPPSENRSESTTKRAPLQLADNLRRDRSQIRSCN